MDELFVVSGYMRTGTSMMMLALEAGGLEACYKQSRDVMKDRHGDEFYDPNLGGLYELEPRDYQRPDFPRGYEGKLIKALTMGVPRMNVMPGGMRVVFMRRDAEEVRQSFDAFFVRQLPAMDGLQDRMDNVIARIQNRRDVRSLTVKWFRDVVENPIEHFEGLRQAGWPIDPGKAAATVDPELCRFKLEELEVGVL